MHHEVFPNAGNGDIAFSLIGNNGLQVGECPAEVTAVGEYGEGICTAIGISPCLCCSINIGPNTAGTGTAALNLGNHGKVTGLNEASFKGRPAVFNLASYLGEFLITDSAYPVGDLKSLPCHDFSQFVHRPRKGSASVAGNRFDSGRRHASVCPWLLLMNFLQLRHA